ncbi:MAG: S8 family serine peptidase, partial [Planctomycetota bacterium]
MLPQLDPQDLANRLSRARIAARRQCAARWLEPAHVRTARERASMLPAADRECIAPMIDAAAAVNGDRDGEPRLEAAAWQAVQTIVGPLGKNTSGDDRTLEKMLARAVSLYDIVLPRDDWARLMLAANRPETRADLAGRLAQIGLMLPSQAGRLADLGLVEIALPPEPEMIHALAALQGVAAMAEPEVALGRIDVRESKADEAVDVRARLNVPEWAGRELGKDVTIALLDSGIDRTHADLAHIKAEQVVSYAHDDGDARDRVGRGTAMAALIAGSGKSSEGQAYRGLAPDARLVVARVCDALGQMQLGAVLNGIEWAVSTQRADIVVLPPLSGDAAGLAVLRLACEALSRSGVLAIVAAGDAGPAAGTVAAPGDVRDAICVGALSADGNLAPFSGRGERHAESALAGKPDCVTPGCDVVAARASGVDDLRAFDDGAHYTLLNSTSASAALFAGCAALVLSAARETHGKATRALQIREALLDNCRAVESASPVWEAGNGLPDVGASLAAVQSDTLPTFQLQMPTTDDTRRLDKSDTGGVVGVAGATAGDHGDHGNGNGAAGPAGSDRNATNENDAEVVEALARDLMDEYDRRRMEAELGAEEAVAAETARGH